MLALLLLACSEPPAPAAPSGPDLSAFAGPERACIEKHCATATDDAALQACRADSCAATAAVWAVTPTLLRYDEGTVSMSVDVDHTPGAFGDVPAPADGETWLGATVLTKSGEEIDMAVHTVFPDRLGEPFSFSSEVGPDVEVVIVGLWGKKIEPCDSTRSGCKMFGFVLDESLAAWPAETYVATAPRRQRFLPAAMTVQQQYPEGKNAQKAVQAALTAETERFGTTFQGAERMKVRLDGGIGTVFNGAAATPGVVLHKSEHDGPLATRLAEAVGAAVGGTPVACHDPAAAADLVVDLTATPPAGAACR